MNRLEFLKRSALIAAGTMVGGVGLSSILSDDAKQPGAAADKKKKIGLQLYSFRDAMKENVPETLKKVAEIGYTDVETAGYADGKLYGYTPTEFKKMCEDLGMKVSSAHLGTRYSPETANAAYEWWKKAFEAQAAAGCKYAIQPSPNADIKTLDNVMNLCAHFNKLGEMAKGYGLEFGYHNHAHEFVKVENGQIIYDIMLANTDPKKVFYELDVYWITKGGQDPVAYMKKYPNRFPVLHIKDESILGESGMMDFEPIFKQAYKNGLKNYYVEVERYTQPVENCIQRSYDMLDSVKYVK